MTKKPKIAIIGGGAAGISAATRLLRSGFDDFVILEAKNRIGGRIHSIDFGGNIVDLGAQWCHGSHGNIVYELVKDLDLLDHSYNNYMDNTYYHSSGKILDKSITDDLFKIAIEIRDDEETAMAHQGTFGDYFIERYKEKVVENFQNNHDVKKTSEEMLEWFHKFHLCLESSKSWFDISAKGCYTYKECDGDLQLQWKGQGYKTILDILMKCNPTGDKEKLENKILLNKEVERIKWDNTSSDRCAIIRCKDESVYNVEHVIITVSLGVLKKNYKSLFDPELPPFKTNAINGLSFGVVNKVFLSFPKRWWPNDHKGFSLVWSQDDRANIMNEFSEGPSKNGRSWLEDVFGFYVIDQHPNVLLGWIVGETAAGVELIPDEVFLEGCMYLLNKFAGSNYELCRPDAMLRSKWSTDNHSLGSYSYVSLETEHRQTSAYDLAAPVSNSDGKETLFFAGEATHTCYYSTVHGAIETGFREAERIIDMYKTPQAPIIKKVAIIGAGMAGLGAAKTLIENGFQDIVIIEAQDEPGGRVKSMTYQYGVLDLGAQWLHGKENDLYQIAKKHDLVADELSEEGQGKYVRDDGYIFDVELIERVNFEIGRILFECQKYTDKQNYPQSVGKYLEEEFEKYLNRCNDSEEEKQLKLQLLDWNIRFQIIDNSCRGLDELSAKSWGRYICLDDEAHLNLKYGFSSIMRILVSELPKSIFLLNTPVAKINYEDITDGYVKLVCQSGVTVFAEHVILTPSLGVLKNFTDICPPLPDTISNAIYCMGFHGIVKIFLIFDEIWWDCEAFQFLWRKNAKVPEDEEWTKGITGFDAVFNNPHALVGWVGGEPVAVLESLSEEQIGRHCMKLLRRFLPGYNIPNPSKVIRTKWLSNPWIRGGYSHITALCDRLGDELNKLAEPVLVNGIPRILLAGEAVHATHFSTAHGAYESGQSQAKLLCSFLNESS